MIGAIIGDIVGSRFESNDNRTREFEFFHPDCRFTDDTVMTVAVADAITSDRPFVDVMHEYGCKYPISESGNCSALRVSPCAFLSQGNRERALIRAISATFCTHIHPESIKEAMSVTDCIFMAKHGSSKEAIRRHIKELYEYDMDFAFDKNCTLCETGEKSHMYVRLAIGCFLKSHDFESAIRMAIALGGYRGAVANITGGIAEAYYGVPYEMRVAALDMLPVDLRRVVEAMYNFD